MRDSIFGVEVGDVVELIDDYDGTIIVTGILERNYIPDEYPDVIIDDKCYDLADEGTTYSLRLKIE